MVRGIQAYEIRTLGVIIIHGTYSDHILCLMFHYNQPVIMENINIELFTFIRLTMISLLNWMSLI